MNVGLYARVSTDDKDQNPERQFIRCRDYCRLNGHDVMGEFSDECSGDTPPLIRESFSSLMEMKPEAIVVFSIDRLSRQHPSKVMQLLTSFKQANILIISVTEPLFNMESPFAEPLQYFITWWNNFYLKKLKEDIKSGIDRARAEGKTIGRPKAQFNQHRAYHLLIVEGKSLSQVAEELKSNKATMHRFKKVCLKNPDLFKKQTPVPITPDSETGKNDGGLDD